MNSGWEVILWKQESVIIYQKERSETLHLNGVIENSVAEIHFSYQGAPKDASKNS